MEIYQRVYLTCQADRLKDLPPLHDLSLAPTVLERLGLPSPLEGVTVVGFPMEHVVRTGLLGIHSKLEAPRQEVVQFLFTVQDSLDQFFHALPAPAENKYDIHAGADLAFSVSNYVDYWCPIGAGAGSSFGTRAQAKRQIHAVDLASQGGVPLDGSGVNVVLVDRGIGAHLPPAERGLGFGWNTQLPFTAIGEQAEHSAMLIRDIGSIAPAVVFWDMPLIPPRVENVPAFLSDAHAAFLWMKVLIQLYNWLYPGQRWVIVNAWATFDLRSDLNSLKGRYRDNPHHHFRHAVRGLVNEGCDVIFAAGNCGEFCPDDRCGPADIGPGSSISGANGYKEVLSVGAARADGMALGYSSQGPGRIPGSAEKPDIVAPSQYRLETDPGRMSTGTSAACGIAAGVVAALRTRPKGVGTDVSPADVIKALRSSAQGGGTYDAQFGCGMLDADAARVALGI